MEIDVDRPALAAYLARMDAAATAAGLPAERRAELLAEIRGHVDDALAGVGAPTDAALADVIDRLGPVEEIVAAELTPVSGLSKPSDHERPFWGAFEVSAVTGLTAGSYLLPVVGTLLGLVCAWVSPRWTARQKSIATALSILPALLIIPGVYFLHITAGEPTDGVTSASILPPLGEALFALALLGAIGSVVAGVFLATRGGRDRRRPADRIP